MTSRLPAVGGDVSTWGAVLNDYLTKTVGQVPGTARVFYLDAYGADPTGAALSDAAWTACYADAAASVQAQSGAVIALGAGTYKFSVSTVHISDTRIGLRGAGRVATNITTTGSTGDLLRFSGATGGNASAAPVGGFNVYGWTAGAAVNGVRYGDRFRGTLTDVSVRGLGGAGSRGYWFNDTAGLSEGSFVQVAADQNAVNYCFQGYGTGGSFDYSHFFLHSVTSTAGGNDAVAMQVLDGMQMYGSLIHLAGNISATTGRTATVLQVGSGTSDTARIQAATLVLAVEADTSAGTCKDMLIQGASANAGIIHCTGQLVFLNASGSYTAGSVTAPAVVTCAGYLLGPLFSSHGTLTALGTGSTLFTYAG